MSKLTYEKLHGGKRAPRGVVEYKSWVGPVKVVGEIDSVSYRADKGNGMETYQHKFEKHGGRGPNLLRGIEEGDDDQADADARLENPGQTKTEIGPIVDVVLADGRRVIIGDAILATNEDGSEVVIESEVGVPFQIETRAGGHYVTERGIEE